MSLARVQEGVNWSFKIFRKQLMGNDNKIELS